MAEGLELRSPLTNRPVPPFFEPNVVLRTLVHEYIQRKREAKRSSKS